MFWAGVVPAQNESQEGCRLRGYSRDLKHHGQPTFV